MTSPEVTKQLERLQNGNARQKGLAAAALAALAPDKARALLTPMIAAASSASERKLLLRCLHRVADGATARALFNEGCFDPSLLPGPYLLVLLGDLQASMKRTKPKLVESALRKLAFLGDGLPWLSPEAKMGPSALRDQAVSLLLDVLDDPRLAELRAEAEQDVLDLGGERALASLLERWRGGFVSDLVGFLAWTALLEASEGAKLPAPEARLDQAALERMTRGAASAFGERARDRWASEAGDFHIERAVLAGAARLPSQIALPFLLALVEALGTEHLAHDAIAAVLALGEPGVRGILASGDKIGPRATVAACATLSAEEAFDRLSPRLRDPGWLSELLENPDVLRDPRFVGASAALVATEPTAGFALLSAIAARPSEPARTRAFDEIVAALRAAASWHEKRRALSALGQTGDLSATPILVAALSDPSLADSIPLMTSALSACGDARAIPALEGITGKYAGFAQGALAHIRQRHP